MICPLIKALPNPSMALLRIKQSKTDPFRRGHKVVLGRSHSDAGCVVAELSSDPENEAGAVILKGRRLAPNAFGLSGRSSDGSC